MTDRERWLNVREAAEYLGLSESTMRGRIDEIPGASHTRGETGDWRVKASMIDAWMAGKRKKVVES